MWIRLTGLAALALLVSCGSIAPGSVSGPVDVVVVAYEPTTSRYVLKTEQLSTLSKLRTLEGTAARIELGPTLEVDLPVIQKAVPKSTAEFETFVVRSGGQTADLDYFDSDGVIYPADAEALALATTYFNFETAQLFFTRLGVAMPTARVAYGAQVTGKMQGQLSPITDNAVSQPYLRVFAVPTLTSTTDVPPGLQLGVVAHQYAHAVFQNQVYPGEALPWIEERVAPYVSKAGAFTPVDNLLRSFDEGIADYFGAIVSDDPTFVRSAPGVPEEDRRLDPANPRCMTAQLTTALQQHNREQYDPHKLGAVISALLWDLSVAAGTNVRPSLHEGLIAIEKTFGEKAQELKNNFTLEIALNILVEGIPNDLTPRVCGLLLDRFRLNKSDIPACGTINVRTPEQKCAI